jgi:antirestriction protein ArdC
MPTQAELRKQITDQIVAALENGVMPWRRPWSSSKNSGRPANVLSKRLYSGINPLLLELHARNFGFYSRWWATFHQWREMDCTVQKRPVDVEPGEWGCHVILYKPVKRTMLDPTTGEQTEEEFPVMRTFTLFNADQIDGSCSKEYRGDAAVEGPTAPDYEPAEELIAATGAELHFGGDEAFYRRPTPPDSWPNHSSGDFISVPVKSSFNPKGSYYETLLHELAHWSEIRLSWTGSYEAGELIAEMAACYLATELGVPQGESLQNHTAYLKVWLNAMKADSSFIFKSATQASKVSDYLLSFRKQTGVSDQQPQDSVQTDGMAA